MSSLPRSWQDVKASMKSYADKAREASREYSTVALGTAAFGAGVVSIVAGRKIYIRYFRRIQNGEWITPDVFRRKRWIKGVVTSVGDADNFRLYHTPSLGWRWPFKLRRVPTTSKAKDLKDQTLHIRIGGVDAPEAGHFGKPAQPYAQETLAWLRNRILGRTVYCQLIRRDQYSRVVSIVTVPSRFPPSILFKGKNLALEMLKFGYGTIYEQTGAEYGHWGKKAYLRAEAQAKAARRGIWKNGELKETPAEYKRRYT